MKRYRFVVLVLLIITVSATGCRRRSGLFGLRGARCRPAVVAAPVQTPVVVTRTPICPTPVCPPACDCCPPGAVYGGQVIQSDPYSGAVYNSSPSYGNASPIDAAPPIAPGGSGLRPAADAGTLNYGLPPAFQVIGDRKLEPGESLPPIDDTATVSVKSEKTAQVPKK